MPRQVVITDCDLGPTDAEERILRAGLGEDVVVHVADCRSAEDVIAAGRDADALLVQWAPVPATVIAQLDRCRVISRYGIGVDMIDVAAARERGIEVLNVPHYCTEEVGTTRLRCCSPCGGACRSSTRPCDAANGRRRRWPDRPGGSPERPWAWSAWAASLPWSPTPFGPSARR